MVEIATNKFSLSRELVCQNIDSNLSVVNPINCPVDPMYRYWVSHPPFITKEVKTFQKLEIFRQLFEWSYGYYYQGESEQQLKRRTPSAGALYPTEAFLVLETEVGWQVLYYHFVSHQFYPVPVQKIDVIVDALGLTKGTEGILLISVLWRTVQRYGVRGYRYSLLDASHVAFNLVQNLESLGHQIQLTPQAPTLQLQRHLNLQFGEALVLAFETRLGELNKNKLPPLKLPKLPKIQPNSIEHSPQLCPKLQRVISFHSKTLKPYFYKTRKLNKGSSVTPQELYAYVTKRFSAKGFTGEKVTLEQYDKIKKVAKSWSPTIPGFLNIIDVYALTIRVADIPVGLFHLTCQNPILNIFGQTEAKFSNRIVEICQNQLFLQSAAFILIIGVPKSKILNSKHIVYQNTILNAGFLCSALYQQALRYNLGTTSIGGYSDDDICNLIGDSSLYPIIVQAFGIPSYSGSKVDAAKIVNPYKKINQV